MKAPTPFKPWAPLHRGVTVLEASAGTGKTYQITNIALRMVTEEGICISKFLIMTFTRAATAELKTRVRERLTDAYFALQGLRESKDDFVLEFVKRAMNDEKSDLYTARLRDALAAFDQAFIVTIHAFCQRMLQANAFESATPPDLELVKDTDEVIHDIVDDAISSQFYHATDAQRLHWINEEKWTRASLRALAKAAVGDYGLKILPEASGNPRADFARDTRTRLSEAFNDRGQLSYNDLLRLLAEPLRDPTRKDRLTSVIAEQFEVVLLDEFQDTDHTQWEIFQHVFAQGQHHLYLIGDPKQAIYSFRGANIQVYLDALTHAQERAQTEPSNRIFTMGKNYRSDPDLITALSQFFSPVNFFGNQQIQFVDVDANENSARLIFPESTPQNYVKPLQIQLCDDRLDHGDGAWFKIKEDAEEHTAKATANEIVKLLNTQPTVSDHGTTEPLSPKHIAVLVRSKAQAALIQHALRQVNVPAIASATTSVFESDEANALQHWLLAIANPSDTSKLRASATTALFGWTASTLDRAVQEPASVEGRSWATWQSTVQQAHQAWHTTGFYPTLRLFMEKFQVKSRLLSHQGGTRAVTNLMHVAELVQQACARDRLTLRGMIRWLRKSRANTDRLDESAEQRLESDTDAVQIFTMHKSKGLQFGVVFAPYLWQKSKYKLDKDHHFIAPDPNDETSRVLVTKVVTKDDKTDNKHLSDKALRAAQEEALRLLYVACTRAKYRLIITFCAHKDANQSALAAALFGDDPNEPDRINAAKKIDKDFSTHEMCEHVQSRIPNACVTVQEPSKLSRWLTSTPHRPALDVATFTRVTLDNTWSRYSYSSINRALHKGADDILHDHAEQTADYEQGVSTSQQVSTQQNDVPFAAFPAGAQAGTFLHEIYEHTPFNTTTDQLASLIQARGPKHGYPPDTWAAPLSEWIQTSLHSPLGGPLGEDTLAKISDEERLDELDFDFTIGKKNGVSGARLREVFTLGNTPLCLPDDYVLSLQELAFPTMAGLLTGSIDLVFRKTVNGHPLWFVADYKSNRLDPHATRSYPAENFVQMHMQTAMNEHHYHLQYCLYTLAIHRYLKLRVADYDYERDFGGVYYLFIRGMTGDVNRGSYFRRPPYVLIAALDALFSEGV